MWQRLEDSTTEGEDAATWDEAVERMLLVRPSLVPQASTATLSPPRSPTTASAPSWSPAAQVLRSMPRPPLTVGTLSPTQSPILVDRSDVLLRRLATRRSASVSATPPLSGRSMGSSFKDSSLSNSPAPGSPSLTTTHSLNLQAAMQPPSPTNSSLRAAQQQLLKLHAQASLGGQTPMFSPQKQLRKCDLSPRTAPRSPSMASMVSSSPLKGPHARSASHALPGRETVDLNGDLTLMPRGTLTAVALFGSPSATNSSSSFAASSTAPAAALPPRCPSPMSTSPPSASHSLQSRRPFAQRLESLDSFGSMAIAELSSASASASASSGTTPKKGATPRNPDHDLPPRSRSQCTGYNGSQSQVPVLPQLARRGSFTLPRINVSHVSCSSSLEASPSHNSVANRDRDVSAAVAHSQSVFSPDSSPPPAKRPFHLGGPFRPVGDNSPSVSSTPSSSTTSSPETAPITPEIQSRYGSLLAFFQSSSCQLFSHCTKPVPIFQRDLAALCKGATTDVRPILRELESLNVAARKFDSFASLTTAVRSEMLKLILDRMIGTRGGPDASIYQDAASYSKRYDCVTWSSPLMAGIIDQPGGAVPRSAAAPTSAELEELCSLGGDRLTNLARILNSFLSESPSRNSFMSVSELTFAVRLATENRPVGELGLSANTVTASPMTLVRQKKGGSSRKRQADEEEAARSKQPQQQQQSEGSE